MWWLHGPPIHRFCWKPASTDSQRSPTPFELFLIITRFELGAPGRPSAGPAGKANSLLQFAL